MGCSAGPKTVGSGLIINIDPGNSRSYAGTGLTISNIAFFGATPATNAVTAGLGLSVYTTRPSTFSAAFGGYIETNITFTSGTAFTISMWLKRNGNFWTSLFGNEVWNNSNGFNGRIESATKVAFSTGGDFTGISYDNAALVSSNFNHYTFVKNASGSNSFIYLNGVQVASGSIANATVAKALRINSRYTNDGTGSSDSQPSEFSQILVYDRALSFQEVQQNYIASKGRFGR